MPRINLLPIKEAQRLKIARSELTMNILVILGFLGVLYYFHLHKMAKTTALQAKINFTKNEISRLEKVVVQVKDLKSKTDTLQQKLDTIDKLNRQKSGPAKMLDNLARILDKERQVWLIRFVEQGGKVLMEGGAMDNENISEFQLSLQQKSKFFQNLKLILVTKAQENNLTYFRFTLNCEANYAAI